MALSDGLIWRPNHGRKSERNNDDYRLGRNSDRYHSSVNRVINTTTILQQVQIHYTKIKNENTRVTKGASYFNRKRFTTITNSRRYRLKVAGGGDGGFGGGTL